MKINLESDSKFQKLFPYSDEFKPIDEIRSRPIYENRLEAVPDISIVIPTYKRSNELAEALESALAQATDKEFEIIVGDNNPEDDMTLEMMMKYSCSKRISYYKHNANLGMAGNWNRLFSLSRTKWTILLHDDDILSPYYIDTICQYLNDDISMIKPCAPKFYGRQCFSFHKPNLIRLEKMEMYNFLWGCPLGSPSHAIFKTSDVLHVGGFQAKYFPCLDYLMYIKLCATGNVYHLASVLGGYRVSNNESLSDLTMAKYWDKRVYISDKLFEFYGLNKYIVRVMDYLCMSSYVSTINKNFRCDFRPSGFSYWMNDKIQRLVIRASCKLAKMLRPQLS